MKQYDAEKLSVWSALTQWPLQDDAPQRRSCRCSASDTLDLNPEKRF
jgi:hypothetical protein